MAKKLNGLPDNLIASFFGTARSGKNMFVSRYYDGGYMADWLSNIAQKYKISKVAFDIKNAKATQNEFNIHPLITNIQDLNIVVTNELSGNGFSSDFITGAKLEVFFQPDSIIFHVKAVLIDKKGKIYESDLKSEESLEPYFDIEETIVEVNKRLY